MQAWQYIKEGANLGVDSCSRSIFGLFPTGYKGELGFVAGANPGFTTIYLLSYLRR